MTPTPTQALEPVEVTQADRELLDRLSICLTDDERLFYIARHRQSSNAASVVGRMGTALDVADRLIERGYGIDVPQEWHDEMREVAEARASLSTPTAEPKCEKCWCREMATLDDGSGVRCVNCKHVQRTSVTAEREAALVAAVRGALECLGKPDGYFPDIGAPKTRALQRAFEAYEPHPTYNGGQK